MLRKADAVLRTEQIESAAVNSAANDALAISGVFLNHSLLFACLRISCACYVTFIS